MSKYRKNEEAIIRRVEQLKGPRPDFYIIGHSTSAMERLGLKIAEVIDRQEMLPFKGLVRTFTIKMPYYEDWQGAGAFIQHLCDSYSIARDCYDTYIGTIVVELAEEWGRSGYNSSLRVFLEYIAEHSDICFILLVPAGQNQEKDDALFAEFVRYGVWMRAYSQTPSVEQCVKHFVTMAEKESWRVQAEAEQLLAEKLKERSESETENIIVVEQLFRQIYFEQCMQNGRSKVIRARDIGLMPGIQKREAARTIGFAAEQ